MQQHSLRKIVTTITAAVFLLTALPGSGYALRPASYKLSGENLRLYGDYNEQIDKALEFICQNIFAGTDITAEALKREYVIRNYRAYRHCLKTGKPLTLLFKPEPFLRAVGYRGPKPYRIAITVTDKAVAITAIYSSTQTESGTRSIGDVKWYLFENMDDICRYRGRGLGAFLLNSIKSARNTALTATLWDTIYDGASTVIVATKDTDKEAFLRGWAYSSAASGVLGNIYTAKIAKDTHDYEMVWLNEEAERVSRALEIPKRLAATGAHTEKKKGFSQLRMCPAARAVMILMDMVLRDKDIAAYHEIDTEDRSIIIQGFDVLGSGMVEQIYYRYQHLGYRIVGVSDRHGAIFRKRGLNLNELIRLRRIVKFGGKVNIAEDYREKVDRKYSQPEKDMLLKEKATFVIITGGKADIQRLRCNVLINATERPFSKRDVLLLQNVRVNNRYILLIPRALVSGARLKLSGEEFVHTYLEEELREPSRAARRRVNIKRAFLNIHFLDNITDTTVINALYVFERYKKSGFKISPYRLLEELMARIGRRKAQLLAAPSEAVERRRQAYIERGMPETEALLLAASELAREAHIFPDMAISDIIGHIEEKNAYATLRNIRFASRYIQTKAVPGPKLKEQILAELIDIAESSDRPLIKGAACESIGVLADKTDTKAVEVLQKASGGSNEHVRNWAVWALERLLGRLPALNEQEAHRITKRHICSKVAGIEYRKIAEDKEAQIMIPLMHYWRDWLRAEKRQEDFIELVPSPGSREDIIVVRANLLRLGESIDAEGQRQIAVKLRRELGDELRNSYKEEFALVIGDDCNQSDRIFPRKMRRERILDITRLIAAFLREKKPGSKITAVTIMSTEYDLAALRSQSGIFRRELRQIEEVRLPQRVFVTDVHGNLQQLKWVIEDAKRRGAKEVIFNGDYFGRKGLSYEALEYLMNYIPADDGPQLRFLAAFDEFFFITAMLGDDIITPLWPNSPEGRAMIEALNREPATDENREFRECFEEGITADNWRFHPKLLRILEWMIEHLHFTYYKDDEGVLYTAGALSPDFVYNGLRYIEALDEMDRQTKKKIRAGYEMLRLMGRIKMSITLTERETIEYELDRWADADRYGLTRPLPPLRKDIYGSIRRLVEGEIDHNQRYEMEIIPDKLLYGMLDMLDDEKRRGEVPGAAFELLEEMLRARTRPLPPVFYRLQGWDEKGHPVDITAPMNIAGVGGFIFKHGGMATADEIQKSGRYPRSIGKKNRARIEEACNRFGINMVLCKYIFTTPAGVPAKEVYENCGVFRIVDSSGSIQDVYYPYGGKEYPSALITTGNRLLQYIRRRDAGIKRLLRYYNILPKEIKTPQQIEAFLKSKDAAVPPSPEVKGQGPELPSKTLPEPTLAPAAAVHKELSEKQRCLLSISRAA